MEFKYWGRTFTSPEEVEAYDAELWKKYYTSNYTDKKISNKETILLMPQATISSTFSVL